MLVAVDDTNGRHTASASLGVSVVCPHCARPVTVRLPRNRVPHFAHRPGERCDAAKIRAERAKARKESAAAARFAARERDLADSGQQALFGPDELDADPAETPTP